MMLHEIQYYRCAHVELYLFVCMMQRHDIISFFSQINAKTGLCQPSCVCGRLLDDAKPSALISHVDSASLVSNTLALCEQRLSSMPIFWSCLLGKSYMH